MFTSRNIKATIIHFSFPAYQQSDTQTTTSTMTHNTRTGSSRIVFTVQELPSPGEYTVVVYLNGHQTQDNLMEIRSSFVLTFFDLPTTTPNSISMQVDQLEDRTVLSNIPCYIHQRISLIEIID